ncbi:hypothetical protein HK100_010561 [Physocladia obscura]|uniref:Uncharacterized protein n=1 Tax=Physocladia obscura TaxID=109957 RepID=A0AAD5T352_9FUNG|nr:hypothetical protein HK100_010561 [Physocladia obscura]
MENDEETDANSSAIQPSNCVSNPAPTPTIETGIEISNVMSNSPPSAPPPPPEISVTDNNTATANNNAINNETENSEREATSLHTPPPEYEGSPLPTGTSLLAAVKMNFDTAPTYFDLTRPSRLEDRISNLTYTSRMASLNAALGTRQMQYSIFAMNYHGRVILCCAIISITGCVALYLVTKQPVALLAVIFTVVFVLNLTPGSAIYTRKCDEFVAVWSKEDEAGGVNLHYRTHKSRLPGQLSSRLIVTILIFEKVSLFNEDGTHVVDALPNYGEIIEMQQV